MKRELEVMILGMFVAVCMNVVATCVCLWLYMCLFRDCVCVGVVRLSNCGCDGMGSLTVGCGRS